MIKSKKAPAAPSTNGHSPSIQEKFTLAREAMVNKLVERDDEIDLVLTALIAREHALLVGNPGTAKSLTLDTIMNWVGGRGFKILMTKFTEPAEVMGPTSVIGLKEDKFRRVTTGMLPEAEFAFLDEIFKSSSAILNCLLTLLNERQFANGTEGIVDCPLRLCVAASNEWPNDENGGAELGALYDRFLFRKTVRPATATSGRKELFKRALGNDNCRAEFTSPISAIELDKASEVASKLPWSKDAIMTARQITNELNREGVTFGDRRFMKSVNAVRAYAYLQGGTEVLPNHLEVLQHILWEDPAEQPTKAAKVILKLCNPTLMKLDVLEEKVNDVIDKCKPEEAVPKLQDMAAECAMLCGVNAAAASGLARVKIDELVTEATKLTKDKKALKLLKHIARHIRDGYTLIIGGTPGKGL